MTTATIPDQKTAVFDVLNELWDAQCKLFKQCSSSKGNTQKLLESSFENINVLLDEFGYDYNEWSAYFDEYRYALIENN